MPLFLAACGGGSSGGAAALSDGNSTDAVAVTGSAASTGGLLVLAIDGANPGVDQDVLNVAGKATLAGTLQLVFGDAYAVPEGQRFTVIKAASFADAFSAVTNNKGLKVQTSQDATNFYVTVSAQ